MLTFTKFSETGYSIKRVFYASKVIVEMICGAFIVVGNVPARAWKTILCKILADL